MNLSEGVQVVSFIILGALALGAAAGLAIILTIYRNRETTDMEQFNFLKW